MTKILKRCTGPCGLEKPLTDFDKNPGGKDGRRNKCKECTATGRGNGIKPNSTRARHPPEHVQKLNALKEICPDDMKVCTDCLTIKTPGEFHRSPKGSFGRKAICKQCESDRRDPLQSRRSNLMVKYGLTLEDYDRMFAEQDGKCFWCGTTEPGGKIGKYFHIDHDHVTNKVICLACASCNVGRGYFRNAQHMLDVATKWREYEIEQESKLATLPRNPTKTGLKSADAT